MIRWFLATLIALKFSFMVKLPVSSTDHFWNLTRTPNRGWNLWKARRRLLLKCLTYIYVCLYGCMHVERQTWVPVCMSILGMYEAPHMYVCMHACTGACTYIHESISMYVCMYAYTCVWMQTYVFVVCTYMHLYTGQHVWMCMHLCV